MEVQDVGLRVELFVTDLPQSVAFYTQILGFYAQGQADDGYTAVTSGRVIIGLNKLANLPDDHPVQAQGGERLGRGVELVLEVSDIEVTYEQVKATKWPIASLLQQRPWGLTDFRVIDPDGYYWRITSRIVY